MITKLRKRFIQITMFSLLAVMLILVIAINLVFLVQNRRAQEHMLERIYEIESGTEQPPGERGGREDTGGPEQFIQPGTSRMDFDMPFSAGYCMVYLDREWNIVQADTQNTPFLDEEAALTLAEAAVQTGKMQGWTGNQIFKIMEEEEGYTMLLADGSGMKSSMQSVLLISTGAASVSYLLVFILVVLFSKTAIRPVSESYEKQKQFITDAGHELKTPLTVISANTEIARMSFGECEWFDGIDKQTEKMQYLVKNLISLTKMDEERTELARDCFCIGDAVYDTAMSYKGMAENRGKELNVQAPGGIMYTGDESAIRQVIAILLDNAMKYSDESGMISVDLREGKHLHLSVANTCEDAEDIEVERLFDRFYRGDKSRSADGGYGLGLSIAKAIIERHGGAVKVYHAEGSRVVFEVVL